MCFHILLTTTIQNELMHQHLVTFDCILLSKLVCKYLSITRGNSNFGDGVWCILTTKTLPLLQQSPSQQKKEKEKILTTCQKRKK